MQGETHICVGVYVILQNKSYKLGDPLIWCLFMSSNKIWQQKLVADTSRAANLAKSKMAAGFEEN